MAAQTQTQRFDGWTITVEDDEWSVMPEGDEDDRNEHLDRYHEAAEIVMAREFPGADIIITWAGRFEVTFDAPEGHDENIDDLTESVRSVFERVFEGGGW